MPAFSLRAKFVAGMMLVISLITFCTLIVTNRNVSSSYNQHFKELSVSQIHHFENMQRLRREPLIELCTRITSGKRITSGMRSVHSEPDGDPDEVREAADRVYKTLEDELRAFLKQGAELEVLFLRVLNEKGEVLQPDRNVDAGYIRGISSTILHQSLTALYRQLPETEPLRRGYISLVRGRTNELIDTVIARIWDPNTPDENFGALVLGFPVKFDMDPKNPVHNGLFVGKTLFAESLPLPAKTALTSLLLDQTGKAPGQPAELNFQIEEPFHTTFKPIPQPPGFPTVYQVSTYSLSPVLEEQARLRWNLIAIAGGAVAVGLILVAIFAHGFLEPIRKLVLGTQEIKKGNFSVKLPITSSDELGDLTGSFNEMSVGLAQRELFRNVLNMVADKTVAEELIAGKVILGGETRQVSVLFCDIRGFTALTEKMPPAEVIKMLNEHMTALTRIVYEYNGVVDKFVGDLIMAIFGAPKTYGTDAENAALCAHRMIEARQKLNEVSSHKIRMGIGIATGQVVAGCMGSADRSNYTVLGERVNLAARLCSKAGPMEVVIDERTNELSGHLFEVETLEPLQLKGFTGGVSAFKIKTLKGDPILAS